MHIYHTVPAEELVMNPIRVIIADDHLMVREGIKQLIEFEGDIKVVGEANDGQECLIITNKNDFDVLLLDINMPNMDGLHVLEVLKDRKVKTAVLMLSVHNEVEYIINSLKSGANGYLLKDSDSAILRKAIFTVASGNNFIQPSLSFKLNERMSKIDENCKSNISKLTKREIEILKLLVEGLFNKEIAYKLFISEKTVKNHVSNIFKKINVSDRTQAAVYAIKNNLVEFEHL